MVLVARPQVVQKDARTERSNSKLLLWRVKVHLQSSLVDQSPSFIMSGWSNFHLLHLLDGQHSSLYLYSIVFDLLYLVQVHFLPSLDG